MNRNILVVGGGLYAGLCSGLGPVTINVVKFFLKPPSFKLVFFTGGADINPELYGEESCTKTHTNPFRDYVESQIFDVALKNRIPMAGVCRGLQFLTVMDGGRMIQHVTDHARFGAHYVFTYRKTKFPVNSLHHQMVVPRENACILCVSPKLSRIYIVGANRCWKEGPVQEIESAYFPDIKAFGVQWHPEMLEENHGARTFFVEHLKYLLSGKFEEILESHNCPTHGDLAKIGRKLKYRKRYKAARKLKGKQRRDGKIRDREVQGQEIQIPERVLAIYTEPKSL